MSDTKDRHLGKTLSLILRHKAKEENFVIDEEGFIKVADILQHRFFKGKYTVEDIRKVVLSNDKKRFTLRFHNDVLEICANQGHSISAKARSYLHGNELAQQFVQNVYNYFKGWHPHLNTVQGIEKLSLTPITTPQPYDVIHGTYYRNWEKIRTEGICRMQRNHIHCAKGLPGHESVISGMRRDCQVYIYINLPLALADGVLFYKSTNEVILTPGNDKGVIEPKYFLKVCNFRGQSL